MPTGLHGHNGLDPATCIHLIMILYVLPVLTYGLEVILPKKKHIDKLDVDTGGGGQKVIFFVPVG